MNVSVVRMPSPGLSKTILKSKNSSTHSLFMFLELLSVVLFPQWLFLFRTLIIGHYRHNLATFWCEILS